MTFDAVLGVSVVLIALVAICSLVAWSVIVIDKIAARNLHSLRDIVKELGNGE